MECEVYYCGECEGNPKIIDKPFICEQCLEKGSYWDKKIAESIDLSSLEAELRIDANWVSIQTLQHRPSFWYADEATQ